MTLNSKKVITIGILISYSRLYPNSTIDFLRNLKNVISESSLALVIQFKIEYLKVGELSNYDVSLQKILLEDPILIVTWLLPYQSQEIARQTALLNIPLINLNLGEVIPSQSENLESGLFFHSLNLSESMFELGKFAGENFLYANFRLMTSFIDSGYHFLNAFGLGLQQNKINTNLKITHIPSKERKDNIKIIGNQEPLLLNYHPRILNDILNYNTVEGKAFVLPYSFEIEKLNISEYYFISPINIESNNFKQDRSINPFRQLGIEVGGIIKYFVSNLRENNYLFEFKRIWETLNIRDDSYGYRITTYKNHTVRTGYLYKKEKEKSIELLHAIKFSEENLGEEYNKLSESITCGFTQPYLISK